MSRSTVTLEASPVPFPSRMATDCQLPDLSVAFYKINLCCALSAIQIEKLSIYVFVIVDKNRLCSMYTSFSSSMKNWKGAYRTGRT